MSTHPPPHISIGHVAMITPDLDRGRRFYEDVIGLRTVLVDHPHGAPFRRMAALTDSAGDAVIVLMFEVPGYQSGLADDIIGRRGRLDHVSFRTTRADFPRVVERLIDVGASAGRVDDFGPTLSVLFIDPDGAHHTVQTVNPTWSPAPSSDVIDRDALQRALTVRLTEPTSSNHH